MADDAKPWEPVLRSLDQVGQRRRDGVRRYGGKATVLATLARADLPVPRGWVLEAKWFDEHVERWLPRKHDLKSLVRLTGTRAGDERCARAYEEVLSGAVEAQVTAAIEALWAAHGGELAHGVAVRPSLCASGPRAGAAVRHLHSRVGMRSAADVVEAVRAVWASGVLANAVAAYAAADVKDLSMAVIVQEAIDTQTSGILTRTPASTAAVGVDDWHLGVLLPAPPGPSAWRRRAQLLVPLGLGRGGPEPPEPLRELRERLGPAGFEELQQLGEIGERELGRGAVLHFAVAEHEGGSRIYVIGADDGPRWQPLPGGDDTTTWVEIGFGGRYPAPPTRLSQSVLDRAAQSGLGAVLGALRCKVPDERALVSGWCGRSYLNLDALAAALGNVPLLEADDLLAAVGGPEERRKALAVRAAASGRSIWRLPLVGSSVVLEQLSLEGDIARTERDLEREARVLGDIDLELLPLDALSTTLTGAQALGERSAELWLRCAAAQVGHALAARALVRRRVRDADRRVGWSLIAGAGGLYLPSMAAALRRAAEVVQRDRAALQRLADPSVAHLAELPDGPARGALGQFLSRYGDLALGAFELSVPRWRELPRDLFTMVRLLCEAPSKSPEALAKQARAAADAELARWEGELGRIERRLLHELVDRARKIAHHRVAIDRHVFRSLALVRRVATDVDRRLRRLDPSVGDLGAFHCSAERLAGALKSGHPELGRIIAMRAAERAEQALEPAPPASFVASPPRGATPVVERATLGGVGASPGVVAGRARVVRGTLPDALEPDDILVVASFDAVTAPLLLVAGGVVAESGGALGLGAEVARELAVPMVASATDAGLIVRDGERLRIDGSSGVVERLDLGPRAAGSVAVAREALLP